MCIYGMWPRKVSKWPWFWAEVAVKAWRDLATLAHCACLGQCCQVAAVTATFLKCGSF
jgi:hypothetical protein